MNGDVTPEEDPKPYLDQVLMVVELYISVLDKTWQRLSEYFPDYTFITFEVVSSRTVGGFNHVYSPCYLYPRVCYVYITTVLLGRPYVLVWLVHK
jgi:hypothetical protein